MWQRYLSSQLKLNKRGVRRKIIYYFRYFITYVCLCFLLSPSSFEWKCICTINNTTEKWKAHMADLWHCSQECYVVHAHIWRRALGEVFSAMFSINKEKHISHSIQQIWQHHAYVGQIRRCLMQGTAESYEHLIMSVQWSPETWQTLPLSAHHPVYWDN